MNQLMDLQFNFNQQLSYYTKENQTLEHDLIGDQDVINHNNI